MVRGSETRPRRFYEFWKLRSHLTKIVYCSEKSVCMTTRRFMYIETVFVYFNCVVLIEPSFNHICRGKTIYLFRVYVLVSTRCARDCIGTKQLDVWIHWVPVRTGAQHSCASHPKIFRDYTSLRVDNRLSVCRQAGFH